MVQYFLIHNISPVSGKRRREEANFPGASIILKQIKEKPQKRRVGFLSSGAPARGEGGTMENNTRLRTGALFAQAECDQLIRILQGSEYSLHELFL